MAAALAAACGTAAAVDWGDNAISYRYGTRFREPANPNEIGKNVVNFSHFDSYKYGSNFLSADVLQSDHSDPTASGHGATEVYVLYRNTLDIGKVAGKDLKWGIVRGWGATAGFDWNTKNDAGYASRKRMWVLGPTVMFEVPGFLNVSVLELWESNDPTGNPHNSRYEYKTHPMLSAAWGIPIGSLPLSYEGYLNYIAAKGPDEFGNPTKPEINWDSQLMVDVGAVAGGPKHTFKVGFEYQYWKNKFGNDNANPFFRGGATARTPMIRAEYHF
ncbi:MAG TPA: outer envelope protein [Burkholderiales bacterium]|jgi:nucleoside-specific outer membrane channel protein Tsx